MRIICISGKSGSGKDFTAQIMKQNLEKSGLNVKIIHFADLLKGICRDWFGWNGEKDEAGRSLLQWVGTDCVRKRYTDFWVTYIAKLLDVFDDQWDYVLIPDTRYSNEIGVLRDFGFNVFTVRVTREGYENWLTDEQACHSSEVELDQYMFDHYLNNDAAIGNEVERVLSAIDSTGIYIFKDKFSYCACEITRCIHKIFPVLGVIDPSAFVNETTFSVSLFSNNGTCGEIVVKNSIITDIKLKESFFEYNYLIENFIGQKLTIHSSFYKEE